MAVTSSTGASSTHDRIAGWLSPHEFSILEAVCDTFFPSLTPPPGSSDAVAAYYRRSAQDLHVALLLAETLALESPAKQAEFRQLLALMAGPAGGLLLIGRPGRFVDLPFEQREKYLQAMANSPMAQLRQGYQAMKRLTGFLYFAVPDAGGVNPNWEVQDYQAPEAPAAESVRPIEPLKITQDVTLECDAVVIGSGAGGGVVAGELAQAGKSVIVLEKGGYSSDTDFTLQEAQATPELYLNRGALTTKDLGVVILAGSTLGGGTVVNWDTSFRTPPEILGEWAHFSGLPDLTGSALQDSFAAVERRISINTENSAHNKQNQLLFDGCRELGYHAGVLRRNAVGCEQRCGACGFGCRYGCKQSTTKTYLQDAYDRGARMIVHCSADRVLLRNGRAAGVEARVTDETGNTYRVTVYAKVVVVAAGALNSPAVLLRSGLDNPHIGRHLHIHPTSTIGGIYPEKVYPWKGVMQSAYSDQFAHLHGNYGYKFEVAPSHPGLIGSSTPWYSAREYREQMSLIANSATIIVLTRDKGEGSVTLDRAGEPVINYVVSVFDRHHLLHGLRHAARTHFAAGAVAVSSLHTKRTRLQRAGSEEISERQWSDFDAQLERHGLGPNRIMMFTAHQMGTCRMGANPAQAVTDGHGQVYGIRGLFVCDGSVFPSASGVNPMLSIMGLAHRSAQYIKSAL